MSVLPLYSPLPERSVADTDHLTGIRIYWLADVTANCHRRYDQSQMAVGPALVAKKHVTELCIVV